MFFFCSSDRAFVLPLPETISQHKIALGRIVVGLFALLGLTSGAAPGRIAKALHRTVARTLRPAESAVRRLIVFLAAGKKAKPFALHPMPAGLLRDMARGTGNRGACFQLFDARPRLLRPQRTAPATRPQPRISFFGDNEVRTLSLGSMPKPEGDSYETSARLVRRLQALCAALENLPRQARRLQRALARRAQSPRLKLKGPLRPGRPPGFRKRAISEIDALLHRCDWLAREALPNTS